MVLTTAVSGLASSLNTQALVLFFLSDQEPRLVDPMKPAPPRPPIPRSNRFSRPSASPITAGHQISPPVTPRRDYQGVRRKATATPPIRSRRTRHHLRLLIKTADCSTTGLENPDSEPSPTPPYKLLPVLPSTCSMLCRNQAPPAARSSSPSLLATTVA